jgi:hypothetical protein
MSIARRDFLQTTAAAGLGALAAPVVGLGTAQAAPPAAAQPPAARELYEWRSYDLRRGPKERLLADHVRDALIPALRRAGTGPVGAFTVAAGGDTPSLHLLIPHPSAESVATLPARLAADAEFRRAGAAVLDAPSSDPVYEGIESALLLAFTGMPRLAVPPQLAAGRGRLFELRRYAAHSERASATKIQMFNEAEIAIFARLGMHAVFYGQAIAGADQPNLTYLLAFDDMRDRDARWGSFGSDPEFRALAARPEYTDAAIVSSISNVFLRPTAFSQI